MVVMRTPSAGQFYIFCDEKYLDMDDGIWRVITGYVAVPQGAWSRQESDRRNLSEPRTIPRLRRIETLLENTDGIALLAYADLKRELVPRGERDGTDDILDMSRTDNVWSSAMAYGLAVLFRWLEIHGLCVQAVDLYHDRRDLTAQHRDRLTEAVTQTLPKTICEAGEQGFGSPEFRPSVGRFEYVMKPAHDVQPDKHQAGVAVAHCLLQQYRDLIGSPNRTRIHVCDNSKQVIGYLRNFQSVITSP